jgi:hypothetical protein
LLQRKKTQQLRTFIDQKQPNYARPLRPSRDTASSQFGTRSRPVRQQKYLAVIRPTSDGWLPRPRRCAASPPRAAARRHGRCCPGRRRAGSGGDLAGGRGAWDGPPAAYSSSWASSAARTRTVSRMSTRFDSNSNTFAWLVHRPRLQNYHTTFWRVQNIINYFTYKATHTVLYQLYEMNPPSYTWLYK